MDARQGLQGQLGQRHQGAGIAGRNDTGGLAVAHRLNSHPHAGRSAIAERRRGPFVGADDGIAMAQFADPGELGMGLHQGREAGLVPDHDEADVAMTRTNHVGAGDYRLRRPITAHGVECKSDLLAHRPVRRMAKVRMLLRARWLDHLAAVVKPAGPADVMRHLDLAAIWAFADPWRRQRMMRATHISTRFGNLFLGYGHGFGLGILMRTIGGRFNKLSS